MNRDIALIDQVLENGSEKDIIAAHKRIASKYHLRIKDFENSMWAYHPEFGFVYDSLGEDAIRENLELMKYKIEGYLEDQGGENNMDGMFSRFPTEKLILHKATGEKLPVTGLVGGDMIGSEDVSVVIEENDVFVRSLPNGIKEYYLVTDKGFVRGTGHGIADHYQTKVTKISSSEYESHFKIEEAGKKPVKIFISHSSKDIAYARKIVEFLEDMNVPEDGIFCSSVPEYGIPGGKKIYEYLRNQFESFDLHVIFVLSENYYSSVASMNEMGAAWVLHNDYTTILLPGFGFGSIKGVIDPSEIVTKLDDATDIVNARLLELRDKVLDEFGLPAMNANKWERKRNEFVKDILEINTDIKPEKTLSELAIKIIKSVSTSPNGRLIRTEDITGNVAFSIESEELFCSTDDRESSKWDAAVVELMKIKCLEVVGTKGGTVYRITAEGYKIADE